MSSHLTQLKKEFAALDLGEKKLRDFGFLVGGLLVALGILLVYRSYGKEGETVGLIGTILVLTGIFCPPFLRRLYQIWMGLALILGLVMGSVLLSVVYIGVLTPIAFVRRTFAKSTPAHSASYWIPSSTEWKKESLEQPF